LRDILDHPNRGNNLVASAQAQGPPVSALILEPFVSCPVEFSRTNFCECQPDFEKGLETFLDRNLKLVKALRFLAP
jgi:hypothetical protein